MKIAFYHELPRGGARRAMNEFAKNLKKSHKVDLYILEEKRNPSENKFYNSVKFYKFDTKEWHGGNWKVRLYKDTIELLKLFFLNKKIAKDIDKKNYDIVLVSASKFIEAPFIMRFLKTRFAFYIHDPFYRLVYDDLVKIPQNIGFFKYKYEQINRFTRKILDKGNVNYAGLCLSPSKYIADKFTKTYGKKNYVVRYGVDVDFLKPGRKKKDYDILYIGSYDVVDGYNLLKNALGLIKKKLKVRLVMAEEEWIDDDTVLRDLYRRAKIVVCTARKEGLGMVPLEAMACGTSVIAVNEAGHKETVINGVTGFLIKRDKNILKEKIVQLLNNPDKIKKLGDKSREIMLKNWSWSVQSQKLAEILYEYKNGALTKNED